MLGIGMGIFMATLDASIVNIALPTLVDVLHTHLAAVEWVVLSYTLVLTSLMLGAARLGDMFDKKKLYLGGLTVFTLGSLLCSLAPSVGWLIGFRALQGLGATFTQALGTAIVTEVFPPQERGRALGITGSIVSVGIAVGPPLGGLLIGLIGWQAIFWVNVPIGIATALVVLRYVPQLQPSKPGQRFDLAGALIMLFTLGSYALGMTLGQADGYNSLHVVFLLVAAVLGLGVFIFVEKRIQQPMIDLSLFRNLLFSLNLLMGMLVFIVLAGNFLFPFLLQNVMGLTTEQAGLLLMVSPAAIGLIAPVAGSLSDRFGSRGISLVGLVCVVAGCLAISSVTAGITPLGFALRILMISVGLGMFQSPNNSAIMGSSPRDRLGTTSGLLGLSRTLGSVTGLPLMGSIFGLSVAATGLLPSGSDVTAAPVQALVSGIHHTYQIAALFILASTLLAVTALWLDPRRKKTSPAP